MLNRLSLGQFLAGNPDFKLHLVEYVVSTRHIAGVRQRISAFIDNMAAGGTAGSGWEAHAERILPLLRHVKAWQHLDADRSNWWADLPILSKADLRAMRDCYISDAVAAESLWLRPTSGTTGQPLDVVYAPDFFFDFQLGLLPRLEYLAGVADEETHARPIYCVALHDRKGLSNRVWAAPDGVEGLYLRPAFDEGDPASVTRLLERIGEWRPALLTLKPNMLDFLLRHFPDRMAHFAAFLRLVVSGGAALEPEVRRTALAAGLRVLDVYGLSEVGTVAAQCGVRGALHVFLPEVVLEVLGADGKVHGGGEGELLVSAPRNAAMPLLRYRTGDTGHVSWGRCGCGWQGQLLHRLAGRVLRNFRLPSGAEVAPTDFDFLLSSHPVREFRLTQRAKHCFLVEIEMEIGCRDPEVEMRAIRENILKRLQNEVELQIVALRLDPAEKFQRYRALV